MEGSPQFSINLQRIDDGVVTLVMSGEFDLAAHEDVHEAIRHAVEVDHAAEIYADLYQVTFIDSSTIHELVHGQRAAAMTVGWEHWCTMWWQPGEEVRAPGCFVTGSVALLLHNRAAGVAVGA